LLLSEKIQAYSLALFYGGEQEGIATRNGSGTQITGMAKLLGTYANLEAEELRFPT
jgi:hypothetical protein